MRAMVAIVALCGLGIAEAQITSSSNTGCTVVAAGGMFCNGLGLPETGEEGKKVPKLSVTHFVLEPSAALEQPSSSSDYLIIGINGGDLLNENTPFLHVSLERDSVTLMPRERPFHLRNKGPHNVEFRLIEIRR